MRGRKELDRAKRSIVLFVIYVFLLVTSFAFPEGPGHRELLLAQQEPHAAKAAKITGIYMRLTGGSEATVMQEKDAIIVDLSGGVPQGRHLGAASPADCEFKARGVLKNNELEATFIPFEGALSTYDSQDALREKRKVKIIFQGDALEVVYAEVSGYCGLHSDFTGTYKKKRAKGSTAPPVR